jgi:hypothetical protein
MTMNSDRFRRHSSEEGLASEEGVAVIRTILTVTPDNPNG